MFQILVCFLCKDCKLPCKRSPPLSQLTPLKIEVLSSPSLFENLVGVSTRPPPPTSPNRKGGCALCLCWLQSN